MDKPKRYHPLLVTLHWLVAVLVTVELYLGFFGIQRGGFAVLGLHMATGIAILALVIVRFVVRLTSRLPAEANQDQPLLRFLARFVHYGLYVMLLVITVIGLTMAIQTNRLQTVFLGAQPQFGQAPGMPPPGGMAPPEVGTNATDMTPPEGRLTAPDDAGGQPGPGGPGSRGRGGSTLLAIHGVSALIIILLILLHVAGATYHQVIRKDNLMGRMGYGKRD
jgi:cytochrome b561